MQQTQTITITTYEAPPPPPPGNAKVVGTILWQIFSLPYASVTINGEQVTTDLNGNFELIIPIGTYTLHVNQLFFESAEFPLDLSEEKTYYMSIQLHAKLWTKIAAVAIPTSLLGVAIAFKR